MSLAQTLILLNEKKVKQSEPWNSTRGIYADYADGFDKPKYYCKCPGCKFVHGFYTTPREAMLKKRCNLCAFKDNEKLKKEVHQIAFAESDEDIDPAAYVHSAYDWEAELRKMRFYYSHPTWSKRRADRYYVTAEHTDNPYYAKVSLVDRRQHKNEEIASVTVPSTEVIKHVLNYMSQRRVGESDGIDPKDYISHVSDWEASLKALGFSPMWSGNTWEREWEDDGQRTRAEVSQIADGRVFVQYYKPDGASWRLVRMDKVPPMELPAYFQDRHPTLSAQLVDHLLA